MSGRFREEDGAATPDFVITSRANARVKQLRAAVAGNARLSGGLIAVEGETLVREALRSGLAVKTIFISERRDAPPGLPVGVEVLRCSKDVLESVADTQTPQGLAALVLPRTGQVEEVMGTEETPALILIAVGLQDPGNLGTLVRSAEAFGATGVLVTDGTVSAWNPKAIRASAGSLFRLPVVPASMEQVNELKQHGIRLLAAVAEHGHAAPASMAGFAGACAVMIGNEGAGLSESWLDLADGLVTIPCPGQVESLNAAVAGSILLYEASRQRGAR